ncbi:MAG: nucleotidyltransferase domain-containing protein [Patescibacteria group bacterium]
MLKSFNQKVKKIFKEKENEIIFAYLFGSQTGEKTNFESDVDIAVYLSEYCKDFFKTRLFLIERLQDVLKKNVEVIILNEQKSIFFKFVIIKEGKIVFEKDHEKRVDFESKIMRDYYDFQPFLQQYNQAYLKRELSKI